MSRVAGAAVKVVLFVGLVAVATVLFRKDSLRGLSDSWTLHQCPDLVLSDVKVALAPNADPKVDHCEGSPSQATCFLETTERDGRRTAPVKNWDCTKRHIREGAFADDLASIGAGGPLLRGEKIDEAQIREYMTKMGKAQAELVDSVVYVTSRMEERRKLLDGR